MNMNMKGLSNATKFSRGIHALHRGPSPVPRVIPRGKIAVFKAGTSDPNFPMSPPDARPVLCRYSIRRPPTRRRRWFRSRCPPIPMCPAPSGSIITPVPRVVFCPAPPTAVAGDGRLHREYYQPNRFQAIHDQTVARGIVTLDAFTNAASVYSDYGNWFGIPPVPRPARRTIPRALPRPMETISGAPAILREPALNWTERYFSILPSGSPPFRNSKLPSGGWRGAHRWRHALYRGYRHGRLRRHL